MTKFKVWIHIEEINEEKDHYQEIDEPQELGRFDSNQDASTYVDQLLSQKDPSRSGLHINPPPSESGPESLFRVVYVIDLNAADPRAAAQETHKIFLDPESMAPVVHVLDTQGHKTTIDLSQ
ncbi:hypothetical protein ACFL6U_24185 [Planctomycetota bacterium]